jgi:hypothetical protein
MAAFRWRRIGNSCVRASYAAEEWKQAAPSNPLFLPSPVLPDNPFSRLPAGNVNTIQLLHIKARVIRQHEQAVSSKRKSSHRGTRKACCCPRCGVITATHCKDGLGAERGQRPPGGPVKWMEQKRAIASPPQAVDIP